MISKPFTKGLEPSLANTVIEDGKFRLTTDSERLFIDIDDKRIEITDFIRGMSEEEILALDSPLTNKFYISSDNNKIFLYNKSWITVSVNDKIEDLYNKINDINSKHIKTLSELGLENIEGQLGFLQTVQAMPDYSRFVTDCAQFSDNPLNRGTVLIEKVNKWRAIAIYITSSTTTPPRLFVKYIREIDSEETSWIEFINSSRIVNNLLATEAGNILDATQGKILNDKIEYKSTLYSIDLLSTKFLAEKSGNVILLSFHGMVNSSLKANVSVTLFTLDEIYRPRTTYSNDVILRKFYDLYGELVIYTTGEVKLTPFQDIPTNINIRIHEVYTTSN